MSETPNIETEDIYGAPTLGAAGDSGLLRIA